MKKFWSEYFGFNRQQRNGLLVLMILSLLLLVVRLVYPRLITPNEDLVVQNLPLTPVLKDSLNPVPKKEGHGEDEKKMPVGNLFVFDPNKVNLEQLKKLGLKEKTARRFIKFRSKGFVFREKEDLKKVYGISEKIYLRLEPYILIEKVVKKESNAAKEKEPIVKEEKKLAKDTRPVESAPAPLKKLDLNVADSAELVALNGIGPSFARRILKYRSMLGGFVSVEQLKEVYGFTEEMYATLSAFFFIEKAKIKKLNVNKDDFKTLNRHPYLSYELTRNIMHWRRKTDLNSTNLRDIFNDDALYNKALPYLEFD